MLTTPITVFTGFLGAGKTSVILALIKHLPPDYKVCLLKNEFGDIQVDSQLAKQSSVTAVSEIMNGCMCCVLVGQMDTALREIKEKYDPDRIFVETSGSAFPATLAFQIHELERDTNGGFKLDAIVTVIDAENFSGYEDTSPTARMQASYTDVILINKWELVSERSLETVLDHLHTLNDTTPKLRCNGRNGVDPALIFGLDSTLFRNTSQVMSPFQDASHNNEVETVTVWKGTGDNCGKTPPTHCSHDCGDSHDHASPTVNGNPNTPLTKEALDSSLTMLSKDIVWRVKGFIRLASPAGVYILNWAFGRYELTESPESIIQDEIDVQFTFMGERGEIRRPAGKFATSLGAQILNK
ncbi:cobW-domain-containing protein [Rickenella mellea]|uniref:CobW-domain-containing protein n=1 Tax=Rickenella mellea TaxID=50990 RepID=A0A4Y7QCS3_9AGAM|nr:cobW-domain-containing protein [Rickenella mellea]